MISDERLQKALKYLATTDQEAASAKALYVGLDEQKKTVFSVAFNATEGPIEARKAEAYATQRYREHIEKLQNALLEYETLRNKRLTEQLIVDVWRTVSANQRKGNI